MPVPLLKMGLVALACSAVLLWAVKDLRMWVLWLFAVAPVAGTYLLSPENRVYSYHGFLHQSLVYQLLEGGVPPGNPLLAGEVARYTWGPHYIVASWSRWTGLSPSWGFALLNIIALVLTTFLLYRTGLYLCGDRRAAVLGVTVSLFGFSFVHLLERFGGFSLRVIEHFALPPAEKFINLNTTPLGILSCAFFLFAVARLIVAPSGRRIGEGHALLLIAVAAAGFLYPLLWIGVVAGGVAALAWLLVRPGSLDRARLWMGAAAAALGTLIVLPYLVSLGRSGSADATLRLAGAGHHVIYALSYITLALPAVGLIVYGRREIRMAMTQRPELYRAFGAVAIANLLLSLSIRGPVVPGIEYKYRMLSFLVVGLVAGIAVETLRKRNVIVAAIVVAMLVLSGLNNLRYKALGRFMSGVVDPFHEEGTWLRHNDPLADELYRWIATETPTRAAFVDDQLTIPVFARRALLVGLDRRRELAAEPGRLWLDGWEMTAEGVLPDVLGAAREEVTARIEVARALLDGERLDWAVGQMRSIMQRAGIEDLYVVLRDPEIVPRLGGDPRFVAIFGNKGATVFRFVG